SVKEQVLCHRLLFAEYFILMIINSGVSDPEVFSSGSVWPDHETKMAGWAVEPGRAAGRCTGSVSCCDVCFQEMTQAGTFMTRGPAPCVQGR
ncbi:MAG TPA: hypothetical protein PLD30_12575, partial [Candidatus Competibacteraceae bacterium]|nr:hypothetical protein [Candidatus Competibacteraceae bacterium]